jgi:hypothetical protein
VGQEKILQLAQQRLAIFRRPFDASYKSRRWHAHVGVRRVVHVEEGGEGHVSELAVATVGDHAQKFLHALGGALAWINAV